MAKVCQMYNVAVKPRKILNLRIMDAVTQQYAIPVVTNGRRRRLIEFSSMNLVGLDWKHGSINIGTDRASFLRLCEAVHTY